MEYLLSSVFTIHILLLTHLPPPPSSPDKMAAVSQTIFSEAYYAYYICVFDWNFTDFFPKRPNDNNQALVLIMAWRRIGDKPLSELILTQFTNAYMRHQGGMSCIRVLVTTCDLTELCKH